MRKRQVDVYDLLYALEENLYLTGEEITHTFYRVKKQNPISDNTKYFIKLPIRDIYCEGKLVGVYLLYEGDEIIYIGQTVDLIGRLYSHMYRFGVQDIFVSFFNIPNRWERLIHENYLIVSNMPKHNLYPFCAKFNELRNIK